MDLSNHLQALASDSSVQSSGSLARCEMANFRWEEAVAADRAAQYVDCVDQPASHLAWRVEHKSHVSSYIQVAKDSPVCAEAFLPVNQLAHLREDLDNTYLLRLESLKGLESRRLVTEAFRQFWQRFYRSQKDLRKQNWSDEDKGLCAEFVRLWNEEVRTQSRPMFATFLNDFGGNLDELIKGDWAHTLRDRLGLSYLVGSEQDKVPVALMCYELREVRDARQTQAKKGATASYARPTVLDTEMSAAFVPAPLFEGGQSYGHTLNLTTTAAPDAFVPELLTYPIEYKAHHIKALGYITRGHALTSDDAWLPARNAHIEGLRRLPDCADFGEILA